MEDLKTLLDKGMSIVDINRNTSEFIHTADGYPDKLKLVYVLLNLIQEGTESLRSVNMSDFISQIRGRVDEIEKQSGALSMEYGTHLKQNNEITNLLTKTSDNRIAEIQRQVRELLLEYDRLVKSLVEIRDRLPIEKQLEQEKK